MAVSLLDVLSCPVCTELFSDPVLLSCGHSFCRRCINAHWTSSSSRRCYICRLASPREPVSNLGLRNACVSYLREQNMRTEEDGGLKCLIHGEKIELFCEIDEKAICSTCMDYEHRWHETQPLHQALRQRKEKLKATLRLAGNTLLSLQNGTSRDSKISNYIQSQTQMTERTIRMEFEKLHQFLRKEEESRIAALNEEEKQKRGHIERRIQGGILSLSDRVREAEQQIEDNAITFLRNYDSILNRAKYTLPDQELSSVTLIDVSKHLGNLKYQVWEKMKDICSYYPVILNPNTAPPDISVSDDLTSVTSPVRRQDEPNAFPLHRSRVVLGSVGYADGVHTWDIEVGDSHHWSLGVCFGLEGKPTTQPLTPENGFWGLRRDGDLYELMTAGIWRLKIKGNPQVVRVKLNYVHEDSGEKKRWRTVSFSDARSDSYIAGFSRVPLEKDLFPFVIPEDQTSPLRVVPAKVILTVEQKLSFMEKNKVLLIICFGFVMVILMILSWKTDQQGR